MCARVQSDLLRVLRVLRGPVFQFCTCLWRHVFGVLRVLCALLGLYVLYALCALYAFSKPYVQHRGPQKRAFGQKRTDGGQRNMIYMIDMTASCTFTVFCTLIKKRWNNAFFVPSVQGQVRDGISSDNNGMQVDGLIGGGTLGARQVASWRAKSGLGVRQLPSWRAPRPNLARQLATWRANL